MLPSDSPSSRGRSAERVLPVAPRSSRVGIRSRSPSSSPPPFRRSDSLSRRRLALAFALDLDNQIDAGLRKAELVRRAGQVAEAEVLSPYYEARETHVHKHEADCLEAQAEAVIGCDPDKAAQYMARSKELLADLPPIEEVREEAKAAQVEARERVEKDYPSRFCYPEKTSVSDFVACDNWCNRFNSGFVPDPYAYNNYKVDWSFSGRGSGNVLPPAALQRVLELMQ